MKLLLASLAVVGIIYISSLNWRAAVKTVFLLIVMEGVLRKWVLPQASDMIYFLKDFVIIGAYLRYFFFSGKIRKFKIQLSWINSLIFLSAGWCIFQAFNPSLGSPLVGIFGLRSYLIYVPLMWMLPTLFESQEELYKFLRMHLLLIIPVGLLGIAQFYSPPTSPLNVYAPGEVTVVSTFNSTSDVRVTGTFSYINSYSGYLIACFCLLIPFLSLKQSKWWALASLGEMLLLIINSFMSGSRSVVLAYVIILGLYIATKIFSNSSSNIRFLKQVMVAGIVIAIAASIWFRPAIDAFLLRTTSNQDLSNRVVLSLTEPYNFMKYKEIDGYGTGATHQGSRALRNSLGLPNGESIPTYYEEEMGRVALELGPFGFILWYVLRISIVIDLGRLFWKLKIPFLQDLALIAFLLHLIQLRAQLVFHHTFSPYYWLLSGFIFLLPQLEQLEISYREQKRKQKLLQQNV